MPTEYNHINHPSWNSLRIAVCYLCQKPLSEPTNNDHIIPEALYVPDAIDKPQLPVHKKCNDSKTLLDERFKYRILLATHSTNALAASKWNEFFSKVQSEKKDDFIIGKNVRNLKLAKTLAKGSSSAQPLIVSLNGMVKLNAGSEHEKDIREFSKKMTRGLFIRNVESVNPQNLDLNFIDKVQLTNEQKKLMDTTFYGLLSLSRKSTRRFMQAWKDNIMYIGFVDDESGAGILWLEFYNTFVTTAYFENT